MKGIERNENESHLGHQTPCPGGQAADEDLGAELWQQKKERGPPVDAAHGSPNLPPTPQQQLPVLVLGVDDT